MPRLRIVVRQFPDPDPAGMAALQQGLPAVDLLQLPASPPLRSRQLQTRAWRREILAGALGVMPDTLQFSQDDQGKPFLLSHRLSFNLSHSRQAFALAWTDENLALGTDIEDRQRQLRSDSTARFAFSEAEYSDWKSKGCRNSDWLRTWTAKEALLKVSGVGLRIGLASVDTQALDAAGCISHPLLGRLQLRQWELPQQILSLAWPLPDDADCMAKTDIELDIPWVEP